jgi:hypothetical protein
MACDAVETANAEKLIFGILVDDDTVSAKIHEVLDLRTTQNSSSIAVTLCEWFRNIASNNSAVR